MIVPCSVVLFLKGSTQDAKTYLETLNDFIATFPNSADGYLNRANHYAGRRAELAATPGEQANYLKLALDDIETASKYSDKKGDVYYNKAKLIYGVSAGDTTLTDPAWSVQAAQQTIQKAIEEDDAPVYRFCILRTSFQEQNHLSLLHISRPGFLDTDIIINGIQEIGRRRVYKLHNRLSKRLLKRMTLLFTISWRVIFIST